MDNPVSEPAVHLPDEHAEMSGDQPFEHGEPDGSSHVDLVASLPVQADQSLAETTRGHASHTRPNRQRLGDRLRIAGAVLAGLAVAACSGGGAAHVGAEGKQSPTSSISRSISPTADIDGTIDFHERVLSIFKNTTAQDGSVISYTPDSDDIHEARSELAAAPSNILVSTQYLAEATDYYGAAAAVIDAPDYPDSDSLKQALNETGDITDPKIKAQAEGAIDAAYVETSAEDASSQTDDNGNYDAALAEQTLRTDLAPIKNVPRVLETADQMLHADAAQSLLEGFSPSDPPTQNDLESFMKSAESISDSSVRHAVIQGAEATFVQDLLNVTGQSYGGYSLEQTRSMIEKLITDPEVKDLALAALTGYTPDIIDSGGYVQDSDSTLALEELSDKYAFFNDLTNRHEAELADLPIQDDQSPVHYFESKGVAAVNRDEAAIDEVLTGYNGHVTAESIRTIAPLTNPDATINLSNVHGVQQIPNLGRYFDPTDVNGSQSETLNQFAEIYTKNGKLYFDIPREAGLSLSAIERLRTIFNNVRPILDAAFTSGDLISVHFVVSDEYDPYYEPVAHQMLVVLPQNNEVSKYAGIARRYRPRSRARADAFNIRRREPAEQCRHTPGRQHV